MLRNIKSNLISGFSRPRCPEAESDGAGPVPGHAGRAPGRPSAAGEEQQRVDTDPAQTGIRRVR